MDLEEALESAIAQVIEVSDPGFNTKTGAVAYYKSIYGDKKSKARGNPALWRENLQKDLLPFVPPSKNGNPPTIRNLRRRFDPDRINTPDKPETNKQYAALAKSIPVLKAPPGGYHFHYEGGILFSLCEERTIDVDITGPLADEVAADPARVIDIGIQVYMQMEGEDEKEVPAPCDEEEGYNIDIDVTITANQTKPVDVRKKHKPAKKSPFFKKGK